MNVHRPRLAIATLQPPQSRLVSKLGGRPWGFPAARWPACRECGRPMALVAQLLHEPPMLDLGAEGRVLHLFQCPTAGCSSYEVDAGCTAGMVLMRDELGEGPTDPPRDTHPTGQVYYKVTGEPAAEERWAIPLNGEFFVFGWESCDDGVAPEKLDAFFDVDAYDGLSEAEQDPFDFASAWRTKSGGAPYWSGNGVGYTLERIPRPPFVFLLQLHDALMFDGPVPAPDTVGCNAFATAPDGSRTMVKVAPAASRDNAPRYVLPETETTFSAGFANFGDGCAYVFLDRASVPPQVMWFWSR